MTRLSQILLKESMITRVRASSWWHADEETETDETEASSESWYQVIDPYQGIMLDEAGSGWASTENQAVRQCLSDRGAESAEHVTWLNEVQCCCMHEVPFLLLPCTSTQKLLSLLKNSLAPQAGLRFDNQHWWVFYEIDTNGWANALLGAAAILLKVPPVDGNGHRAHALNDASA